MDYGDSTISLSITLPLPQTNTNDSEIGIECYVRKPLIHRVTNYHPSGLNICCYSHLSK